MRAPTSAVVARTAPHRPALLLLLLGAGAAWWVALLLVGSQSFAVADEVSKTLSETASQYVILLVSGGLQDGFYARPLLDYVSQHEFIPAQFIGPALVRGAKSFLDIKEEESVEYRAAPRKPEVNPVVIASGCDEHANIYGAYAVDVRAAMRALALEPRFLSITPSTGLVDLMAEETGDNVRALAFSESERIGGSGSPTPKHAAFLTVMGTWPNAASLQPNPVLYVKEDGTQVTDFPRGLAKWAGTTDEKRRGADTESAYWAAVNERIRTAENEQRLVGASLARGERVGAAEMFRFDCERKAQYSADHQSVKVIRFFEKWEIEDTFGNVCSYS